MRALWLLVPTLILLPTRAWADVALRFSRLPLSKTFDQPFFSLDGSHVELFSLLFLFMAAALVMSVRKGRQAVRHLVQLISIVLFFYVVYSCLGVFGMIRNTFHGISLIGTVYTESFFWMSLPVAVMAFTLVTGPFFCGWICPTGTIQEWVAMLREWITRRPQLTLSKWTLSLAVLFAAGFLYLVLAVSAERKLFLEDSSLYWAASSLVIPMLVLGGLASDWASRDLRWLSLGSILLSSVLKVTITSPVHFAFVDVVDPASAITTLVLAVASIFIARSWCRYLCPWGKLMALLHRHSRLAFEVTDACTGCKTCVPSCRVGAIREGRVEIDACQFCYACLDVCPNGAIEVVDRWRRAPKEAA